MPPIAAQPIPADRTHRGSLDAPREHSLNIQQGIVAQVAKHAAHVRPGSIEQKIGWLHASGMDEAAIGKAGHTPMAPEPTRSTGLGDSAASPAPSAKATRKASRWRSASTAAAARIPAVRSLMPARAAPDY